MPTVDELQSRIDILSQQQALTVQALRAFLSGELDGAGSAKAYLLAIDPGLEVTPADFAFGA